MDITYMQHWVSIRVKKKMGCQEGNIEFLSWAHMTFKQRTKWNWYFIYRAALLQVKYPKYFVEFRSGHEPAQGKTLQIILADKIKGKQSTITKFKNKIKLAETHWSYMFPIEDDPDYKRACAKVERLEQELIDLKKNYYDANCCNGLYATKNCSIYSSRH